VSRCEFLAQGFITGAAWITAPTILGLFKSSEARAQAAAASSSSFAERYAARTAREGFASGRHSSTCVPRARQASRNSRVCGGRISKA